MQHRKIVVSLVPPSALALMGALGCQTMSTFDEVRETEQEIIGGPVVTPGSRPWAVKLTLINKDSGGMVTGTANCAGTLIAPDWVLTAAHCVFQDEGPVQYPSLLYPTDQIQVTLGEHDLAVNEGTEQTPAVVRIIPHELFEYPPDTPGVGASQNPGIHDVALLELDHSVVLGPNVQPIRLAQNVPAPGSELVDAGWGVDVFPVPPSRAPSQFLRELPGLIEDPNVPSTPGNLTCNELLMNSLNLAIFTTSDRPVRSDEICLAPQATDEPPPYSACYGDSGSAWVTETTSECSQAVGVHTWGYLECLYFGVAQSIPANLSWIRTKAAGLAGDVVYEAENMNHQAGAAHPYGWNIHSNGYISFNHTFQGGPEQFVVRASGQYGNGWPQMVVRINGAVVYQTTVNTADYANYTFTASPSAGNAQVQIAFTNDLYQPPVDRNLFIDKVALVKYGCPPVAPPSVCDEATAIDLGAPGQNHSVPSNACVRVRDGYPSWWGTNRRMKLLPNGASGFPLSFTWSNTCAAGTGAGTFPATWSPAYVNGTSSACATVVKLGGSGGQNINLAYFGE